MRKLWSCLLAALLLTACTKEIINQPETKLAQKTAEMGTPRYPYGGFTPQDLKNRASIPSQADITVYGDGIVCGHTDIPTEIKAVIGESTNDCGMLCLSPKVNIWSNFSPREWYLSGGSLLNRAKYPYDMSNFCGYNHNALAPGYASGYMTAFTYNTDETVKTISVALFLREIDFATMVGATRIKLVVKEGANTLVSSLTALGAYTNLTPTVANANLDISAWNTNKTISVTTYLSNVAGDELCKFPNTDTFNITATVLLEPTASCVGDGATLFNAVGTSVCSINRSNQFALTITSLLRPNMTPYTQRINIKVLVYNASNVLQGTYQQVTTLDNLRNFTGTIATYTITWGWRIQFIVTAVD